VNAPAAAGPTDPAPSGAETSEAAVLGGVALGYTIGGSGNTSMAMVHGAVLPVVALRFVLGALIFTPATRGRVPRRARGAVFAFGICEATAVLLLFLAAGYASVVTFTVLGALVPVGVASVARLLGRRRMTRVQAVGACVVVAATTATVLGAPNGVDHPLGIALATASSAVAVAAALLGERARASVPAIVLTASVGVVGAPFVLALVAIQVIAGRDMSLGVRGVLLAVFVAVIPGGLGKTLVLAGQGRAPIGAITACSALSGITAAVGARLVLDQALQLGQILCFPVALLGVVVLVAGGPSPPAPELAAIEIL
jgi:drug/metabolite transporter (DMT)-like permease